MGDPFFAVLAVRARGTMIGVENRNVSARIRERRPACMPRRLGEVMLPAMSTEKHSGGCHCGRVRYDVTMDLEKPVIGCNCSMCGKKGTLLAFVPTTEFKLVSGEGSLTSYKFNKKVSTTSFAPTAASPRSRAERSPTARP
jgi:hypothetical protein